MHHIYGGWVARVCWYTNQNDRCAMKRNNLHTTIEINYPCMAEQPRTHILQIGPSNCPARIYLSSCMCRCGMCLKLKRNDGRSKCPKFNQAPVIWHCNNWYGMFTCVFSPFFFFFSCEISHTSVAKIGKKVVFFCARSVKSNQLETNRTFEHCDIVQRRSYSKRNIDLEMIDGE